ncbi:MAG: YitT family protein [Clostridia bacterium]|nr:YitT family protein [Clostridia bacterium]MDF2891347.1 YitT family protein [Clostridia bacterium]
MKFIDRIYDGKYKYIFMILMIILGSAISGVAFNLFIIPNKLLSGGISGISLILNYLFNINTGLMIFIFNIPIFIFGYKFIDKEFVFLSLIGMIAFSTWIEVFSFLQNSSLVQDVMLSSIYAGVLNGIGLGIVLKNRASQGGIDIIAVIIKKYFSMNIGSTSMIINTCIVVAASFITNLNLAMYTLISMYVGSTVMDKIQQGFDRRKSVMIITNKEKQVAEEVFKRLVRGVTYLEGEGAYTGDKKRVIYCIVSLNQLAKLKQIVREVDENAFITVSDTSEVMGHGFTNRGI